MWALRPWPSMVAAPRKPCPRAGLRWRVSDADPGIGLTPAARSQQVVASSLLAPARPSLTLLEFSLAAIQVR